MTDRAALIRLGKLVAEDVAAGRMSDRSRAAAHVLERDPGAVIDLVHLLAAEARRKRPSQKLVSAYAYLIEQMLEFLRFGIEGGHARAAEIAKDVRRELSALAEAGQIDPSVLLLILGAFSNAKLDPGDDLRRMMARLTEGAAAGAGAGMVASDPDAHLQSLVEAAGGDPFVLHAQMIETAEAFPEEHRAAMGAMLLRSTEPVAREAAIGWLLDGSAKVRNLTAAAIEQAAPTGGVSGTMLRRMIALRNWLPEPNRAALDRATQACRRNGVECAAWPNVQVREIGASGIDGAGAQSLFAVAREGRRSAVACLLVKLAVGVRDAWARHALSRAELDEFGARMESGIDMYPTNPDYVRIVSSHFLSVNLASGVMPPFGMLDFAETVGQQALQPEPWSVSRLIGLLEDAAAPALLQPGAIKAALERGTDLAAEHGFLGYWFEDDDEVTAALSRKRRSQAERAALVRDMLSARRERWGTALAWTALMLQQSGDDERWHEFFVAAREVTNGRSLDEIPLMTLVAEQTVAAVAARRGERGHRR